MATLNTLGVISSKFDKVPGRPDQSIGIWVLTLQSAEDTFTVPDLESTSGVGSMTSGISVSAAANSTAGTSVLTVTGGSFGTIAIVTTLHLRGRVNNLAIADPA